MKIGNDVTRAHCKPAGTALKVRVSWGFVPKTKGWGLSRKKEEFIQENTYLGAKTSQMALVQSNACDPFDRLSQRELLARILSSESREDGDHHSMDCSSDSEHEYEQEGKKIIQAASL